MSFMLPLRMAALAVNFFGRQHAFMNIYDNTSGGRIRGGHALNRITK